MSLCLRSSPWGVTKGVLFGRCASSAILTKYRGIHFITKASYSSTTTSEEEKANKKKNKEYVQSKFIAPPLHFHSSDKPQSAADYTVECFHNQPHPVWTIEEVNSVQSTHFAPRGLTDVMAFSSVKLLRFGFDLISGYSLGLINETGWINRIIFLETVAGVPGLIGAMWRHLRSLRRMERDYGWIHTLLEEAENERMHLMSALEIKQPGYLFRLFVLVTQGIFLPFYSLSYLVSPKFCHRFVGYLEEEAIKTYSKLLHCLDSGQLPQLSKLPASRVATMYWQLPPAAGFRDMVLAIRADESHHRDVNHTFAALKKSDLNPFPPGH